MLFSKFSLVKALSKKDVILGDAIFANLNSRKAAIQSPALVVTPVHRETDIEYRRSARVAAIRLGIENLFGVLNASWRVLRETWRLEFREHHKVWLFVAFIHNSKVDLEGLEIRSRDSVARIRKS